jgi:predicted lactoylglutathione lyase
MSVTAVTPILNVSDLQASFVWFAQFGWKKHWDFGDPPNFGAVISGKTEIFLCQDGQGARGGAAPREAWDNQAGSTWMSWWVESAEEVDAVYARAMELGVEAPWPPTDMPWNVRECHIRHPDGHTMRVSANFPED